MQILRPHPRPRESNSGTGANPPLQVILMLKSENSYAFHIVAPPHQLGAPLREGASRPILNLPATENPGHDGGLFPLTD